MAQPNNAYMMTLQAEYLACRESKALYDELCKAIYTMALIQTKNICRNNKMSMHKDLIITTAEDVVIMLMERYKRNPAWQVKASFINEIAMTCAHFMFDKRYKDRLQYRPMDTAMACEQDLDAEANKARVICAIQLASIYAESIVKKAQAAKHYAQYLTYITERHSIAWIEQHFPDVRALWLVYHG